MNLKLFTPETFPKSDIRTNTKPSISFGKSGVISFNPAAIRLMDLNAGDGIIIAADEDHSSDYYVTKHKDGYVLRVSTGTVSLIFNHKGLCEKLMSQLGYDTTISNRIMISNSPVGFEGDSNVYYGLLGVINKR